MPSFAGVPYNVDDPGTTEPHHYAVILAYLSSKAQGSETEAVPNVTLTYGLNDKVELDMVAVEAVSVRNTGSDRQFGFGDVLPGIRWRFLEETKHTPQVGLAYYVKIPTASKAEGLGSGAYDHQVYTMAAKSFGRYSVFANGGYNLLGASGSEDNWFYGTAITFQSTEKLVIGAQLYGNSVNAAGGKNELAYGFGGTYASSPDTLFMLSAGRSTRGLSDLNVYAAVQFTLRPKAKAAK